MQSTSTKRVKIKIHFASFLVFLLVVSGAACLADEPQPTLSQEVEVSLLSVYAVVTDSKGKPVRNLKEEDFQLTDAGASVNIEQFSGDPSEPASVAFLLDTSGSMRLSDKYDAAIRVIESLMDLLQADDEVSLITFSDEEVRTVVEFTKDKSRVSNSLASQKLYGPTALWDAILFTQRLVIQSYGKKAVVLISDGLDTRSENMFQRAVEESKRIQLPVYILEISIAEEAEERELNFASPLKDFAESTGALHFQIEGDKEKEIHKIAEKLKEEIRYQYYIGISGSTAVSPHLKLSVRNEKYNVRLRHSLTELN